MAKSKRKGVKVPTLIEENLEFTSIDQRESGIKKFDSGSRTVQRVIDRRYILIY